MKITTMFAASLAAFATLSIAPPAHADDPAPTDPDVCQSNPDLGPGCIDYDRTFCIDDDGDGTYVIYIVTSHAEYEYMTGTRYFDYPRSDTYNPDACSVYDVPGGYGQPSTPTEPTEPATDEPTTPVKHPVLAQERICKAKVFKNRSARVRCADRRVSHLELTRSHRARGGFVAKFNNGASWRLTPCRQEDSVRCFWDARRRGNEVGHSFVALYGKLFRY